MNQDRDRLLGFQLVDRFHRTVNIDREVLHGRQKPQAVIVNDRKGREVNRTRARLVFLRFFPLDRATVLIGVRKLSVLLFIVVLGICEVLKRLSELVQEGVGVTKTTHGRSFSVGISVTIVTVGHSVRIFPPFRRGHAHGILVTS